jgi:hypothetical protein
LSCTTKIGSLSNWVVRPYLGRWRWSLFTIPPEHYLPRQKFIGLFFSQKHLRAAFKRGY